MGGAWEDDAFTSTWVAGPHACCAVGGLGQGRLCAPLRNGHSTTPSHSTASHLQLHPSSNRYAYPVTCTGFSKDASGRVTEVQVGAAAARLC